MELTVMVLGQESLTNIITNCVILDNMIIKNERGRGLAFVYDSSCVPCRIEALFETYWQIENRDSPT
jgi:hypothetical protein